VRKAASLVVATAAASVFTILLAGPAGAATATGCSGSATSTDKNGIPVDQVAAPGPGGTKDNPFKIAYDGHVKWQGKTDTLIKPGKYEVDIGLPFSFSGTFKNGDNKTQSSGNEKVSDRMPVKITGLFKVDVKVTGTGGSCSGSAWLLISDSPLFTPLWFASVVLLLLAVLLFYMGVPANEAEAAAEWVLGGGGPGGG